MHAFQNKPGLPIDPPKITRCRLDAVKVDHFLDFLSSPSFLQDVAYGTRTGEWPELRNPEYCAHSYSLPPSAHVLKLPCRVQF